MNPLSGVLSEAWAMYRAHARHLLTIAFVVYAVAAGVELALGVLGTLGVLLAAIVGIVAAFLLQAALVKAVEDIRDGRADMSLGDTLAAARPFVGQVAIASVLAGIGIGFGLLLLLVPGLVLLTIWAVIVPVIVLEGVTAGASFARSRALVKRHGWEVFGTLVLVFLLLIGASLGISLALGALPKQIAQLISSIVSGTLVAPFLSLVVTLVYFRLLAAQAGAAPGYDLPRWDQPGYPPVG